MPPKGYKSSDETKAKLRLARLGKKHTEETKARMSEMRKAENLSPEIRAKIKAGVSGENNGFYGKRHSKETKEKIGVCNKGRNAGVPRSETTKIKIGVKHKGKTISDEHKIRLSIANTGRYVGSKSPNWTGGRKNYCEKWTEEFRRRIRVFFGNKCVECGAPQNGKKLHCHHVYYDKKACCEESPDGKYYSDLGVKGAPKTFEIIGDPNKFVPLCQKCHAKTTPKKDRVVWARKYERMINEQYNGKSYFEKGEL